MSGAAELSPAVAAALAKAGGDTDRGKKECRPADGMEGKEDAGSEANSEASDEASACARLLLAAFSSASSEESLVVALDALRAAVENEEVPLAKQDVVAIARLKKAEGAVEWTRAVAAALGALLKSFGGRSRVDPPAAPALFPSACLSPAEAAFEWTGGGDATTAQGNDNYTPILGSVGFAPDTGVVTWSIVGTRWRRAVAGVCLAAATTWLGNANGGNQQQQDAWCYASQAKQGGWIEVWRNAEPHSVLLSQPGVELDDGDCLTFTLDTGEARTLDVAVNGVSRADSTHHLPPGVTVYPAAGCNDGSARLHIAGEDDMLPMD